MFTCRICGNNKVNSEFIVQEMMYGLPEKFSYFECSCCGCLQITDFPIDMAKYYPSNYYSFNASAESTSLLKRVRNMITLFDKGILGRLVDKYKPDSIGLRALACLPLNKNMRIIDVGCGGGKLLCSLRELGFKNLLGVDPYIEQDIDYHNGVRVLKDELKNISGSWDVVMFHHSFEHILEQLSTLRNANRLLDNSGTCLIRVPISSSFAWRHYGVNWFQLDAPRHFFLHSAKSMSVLAEHAGFFIEKIEYDSTILQFTGSELYLKNRCLFNQGTGEQNVPASFFSAVELRKYSAETKLLNARSDGDQAAFYLKKYESCT